MEANGLKLLNQAEPGPSFHETDISGTEDFAKTFQLVLDDLEKQSRSSGKLKTASARTADSLKHLEQLLAQRSSLKALLNLHKKVSEQQFHLRDPVFCGAGGLGLTELSYQVTRILGDSSREAQDISRRLNAPFFLSLCAAYDDVANRQYEPFLPEIPHEVDEDEGVALKIVRLVKNHEPLGATIKCEEDGSVVIARVMKGGAADRSGCIQVSFPLPTKLYRWMDGLKALHENIPSVRSMPS